MRNSTPNPIFEAYARLHWWPTTSSLVSPHDMWRSTALANILAWVCSIRWLGVCMCHIMDYKLTKVYTIWHSTSVCYKKRTFFCISKRQHTTLVINMFKNISPLHHSTQNYHLKHPIRYTKMSQCTYFSLNFNLCWWIISYWQSIDVTLTNVHASSFRHFTKSIHDT